MLRLALALTAIALLATAGGAPLRAFPAVAEFCNAYAADQAAGRPGAPYDVGAEPIYMHAYKYCMKAHDTPLDVTFMKFGHEALAMQAAEDAWRASFARPARDRHAYCRAKYRSYDPATGHYRTYSGKLKRCL